MFSRSLPRFRSSFRNLATLLVHGNDGKGIVSACSNMLDQRGYEIVDTEHWTDRVRQCIFLRIDFHHHQQRQRQRQPKEELQVQQRQGDSSSSSSSSFAMVESELRQFCQQRQLHCTINWRQTRPKLAIMVSKDDHCLWELLLRHEAHELDCDIVAILSNHDKLAHIARTFQIPFHVFPITPDTKHQQEHLQLQLLHQRYHVDIVVLARYMQVLSESFLNAFPNNNSIINIHHSFLPAFSGKRPYHAAHERGVKLVGATAHYTTAQLDQGPIIEQAVIPVTHRDEVHGLIRKGRLLERKVLVKALQAHLDDRVIVYDNKCVVFAD
jgi:formyltetrahydrofolate deformylase